MTYELAKKLKDVGFLFIRINGGDCVGRQGYFDFNPEGDPGIGAQHFYIPTLSELIEACGVHFYGVSRNGREDGWVATQGPFDGNDDESGSTPEEAVAKLYLALNQK